MKAATLESKFPLLAVENGCIVSKEADVTVAFRVELPELFSVTGSEYEAVHSAWHKAVKVLPEYSIVHKQDFFIEEKYRPETDRDDLSFLSRSFERHFNERPFLNHFCYLFLTKTTKARSRQESTFSTLCKGRLVPKEIEDRETVTRFLEAVGQFEKIMNDSGFVTLRRLTTDEITGTERSAGIVEKYLSLSQHDTTVLKDIQLNPEEMRIGDDILCLHTLSDTEDLPGKVATDSRYERLSTDRSDCRLSFAAPGGLAAGLQPLLQPVHLHRRPRGEPETLRADRPEHALALPLLPLQPDQQGMDRGIPERGALERADLGALPLQRDGVERRPGGA